MELQQLRYVVAVAETGGFTRAAERCLVVQSALSHQIAKLERELGARLFERTSRRVRLTPAGEAFLPAARQSLQAAERARAEVAAATGEIRGRLTVGAIGTITAVDIPGLLAVYRARHPQVGVNLLAQRSETLAEEVRGGTVDLGFLGVEPAFEAAGLHSRTLVADRHVAVISPDHPLAGDPQAADPRGVTLARLAREVFVDWMTGTAARAQTESAFAAAGLRREVAFEVGSMDYVIGLVRHGLGVALLPSGLVPRLEGVRVLPVRDGPSREERVVWHQDRLSPAAGAFLETVRAARVTLPPAARPPGPAAI